MARENLQAVGAAEGLNVFNQAAKEHLEKFAYAPDQVKFSKKDIRKLMMEKKVAE